MARKALGKKVRFEVFKRDGFLCQYCGRKPPDAVLEIDHLVALANGGDDSEANLVTACVDCNRGKGARALECAPMDLAQKAAQIHERREQVEAYTALLVEEQNRLYGDAVDVSLIYEGTFPGWEVNTSGMESIKHFLGKLPKIEVEEAMTLACTRMPEDRAFKYFCGICWKKIRGEVPGR